MSILRDKITELVAGAEKWRSKGINEADTKALLIEPLLRSLGWDVSDLDSVTREFRVYDGTFLDYALKIEGSPRLFVEAKALGKSLTDRAFIAQTVNYANNEGVVWCVLTNGLLYRVYKTNEPAEMERKLLFEVDLSLVDAVGVDGGEFIRKLTYLSRDSIEDGSLDEWGELTFTDGRVKAALTSLLSNPSTKFINQVMERATGSPTIPRDTVKESLRRLATELGESTTTSDAAPSVTTSQVRSRDKSASASPTNTGTWTPLDGFGTTEGQAPPREIRLPNGTIRTVSAWKGILIEVARYLIESGAITSSMCPIQQDRSKKRYLVHSEPRHPTGKDFFSAVQIGKMWVEAHASAKVLHQQAQFLIRRAGQEPAAYHVRLG